MKKAIGMITLVGALSLALTGTASAKCYKWKKVCHPIFKHKIVWRTCYNSYDVAYQCKKKIKVKAGHKCKNKCISWKPPVQKHHEETYDSY